MQIVHSWWWQKFHLQSHSVSLCDRVRHSRVFFDFDFKHVHLRDNENNLISHIDSWKVGYELQFCAGIGPFISA